MTGRKIRYTDPWHKSTTLGVIEVADPKKVEEAAAAQQRVNEEIAQTGTASQEAIDKRNDAAEALKDD